MRKAVPGAFLSAPGPPAFLMSDAVQLLRVLIAATVDGFGNDVLPLSGKRNKRVACHTVINKCIRNIIHAVDFIHINIEVDALREVQRQFNSDSYVVFQVKIDGKKSVVFPNILRFQNLVSV